MFSCVWLHFKKFSGKYFLMFGKEGKDKPKKNIINNRDLRSRSRRRDLAINASRDRDQLRDLATARSREGEIAIDASWDRAVDRDLRGNRRTGAREISAAWSSESAGDRRTDWNVSSPLARTHSLSLSLFPEMLWSENEGRKSFPGQRWKYWSTGSHFPENIIFRDSQTCGFGGKWFSKVIFTQNKHSLSIVVLDCSGKKLRIAVWKHYSLKWNHNTLKAWIIIMVIESIRHCLFPIHLELQ